MACVLFLLDRDDLEKAYFWSRRSRESFLIHQNFIEQIFIKYMKDKSKVLWWILGGVHI